jgi:hypothetical protein
MSRLRRVRGDSRLFSIAGELLEIRSLLSAGAGAALAAANQAALAHASEAPAAKSPQASAVPVLASFAVNGIIKTSGIPGTLSLSITKLDIGGQVTGKFSLSQGSKSGGGDYVTARGTFSGHIVGIAGGALHPTAYTVTFETGSVHETQRISGHTTSVTAVHPPHNSVNTITLVLEGTSLAYLDAPYSSTKLPGGGKFELEASPAPV